MAQLGFDRDARRGAPHAGAHPTNFCAAPYLSSFRRTTLSSARRHVETNLRTRRSGITIHAVGDLERASDVTEYACIWNARPRGLERQSDSAHPMAISSARMGVGISADSARGTRCGCGE